MTATTPLCPSADLRWNTVSLTTTVSQIDSLSDEQRECLETYTEATQVCEWCADRYLGDSEMKACARRCRDVADLASLHARFVVRGSEHSTTLVEACAEACESCADECSNHEAEHCRVCPEVLRECAASCRNMASA